MLVISTTDWKTRVKPFFTETEGPEEVPICIGFGLGVVLCRYVAGY